MGTVWIIAHFVMALPASVVASQNRLKRFTYTFGYIVVIMRFFTIAGIFIIFLLINLVFETKI